MGAADERLRRLIDRQTPKLQRLLLAALRGLSQGSVEALTQALEAQDLQAAITAAVGELDAIRGPLRDQLLEAISESARVTTARFGMSFDLADPNAIRVAESLAANAVVGVELETKQAIRDIIVRGFQEGIPPRAQAREIMRLVGLPGRDATAVDSLWMRMMGDGVKQDVADARAMRYADRLLRRRAENIARTEMISASTQGRRLGWQQAADAGLVDPATARIVWILTQDDRLCNRCAPMAGMTVGFYDGFTSTQRATGELGKDPGGITPYTGGTEPLKAHVTVNGPPLHVNCRCDLGLVSSEGDVPQEDNAEDDARLEDWPRNCDPPWLMSKDAADREECPLDLEQWAALEPEKEFVDQTEADRVHALLEQTKDGRQLLAFLRKWQGTNNGPSITNLRADIARILSGDAANSPALRSAETFLRALRTSPWPPPRTLWRGASMDGTLEDALARFVEGSKVDWNLSSFTADRAIAQEFAGLESQQVEILYQLVGAEQGLPMQNLSAAWAREREWIVGGRFEIDSVTSRAGNVLVKLIQLEGL